MKKKKIQRKDKPPETRYVVVRADDARIVKYQRSEKSEGFALSHAESLAAPVEGQPAFGVVSVEVYEQLLVDNQPLSLDAVNSPLPRPKWHLTKTDKSGDE